MAVVNEAALEMVEALRLYVETEGTPTHQEVMRRIPDVAARPEMWRDDGALQLKSREKGFQNMSRWAFGANHETANLVAYDWMGANQWRRTHYRWSAGYGGEKVAADYDVIPAGSESVMTDYGLMPGGHEHLRLARSVGFGDAEEVTRKKKRRGPKRS